MAERSGRSCQACKDRHLRCSKEWPCGNCTKAGLDCQKPGHFQFLHSKTPRFPDDQVWLSTADEIYFNTESGDILSTSDSEDPETRLRIPRETSPRPSEATLEDCADLAPNDEPLNGASRPLSSRAQTTYPGRHRHSTSVNFSAPIRSDEDDYHPASSGVHDGVFQNCGRSDSTPLHQDSRACLFPLSDTDAELTRYFFKTLASWFDCLDHRQQFTTGIYALLPQSTLLLYAVLSVAARHLAVLEDYNPIAADERHQKCVQQLRQRLSCLAGGNGSLEDDILAATVVLRLDSEFEVLETGLENHCHLLGTQGLLHCYEKAATLSRFQKVVAWIGLRQDVIISFMEQRSVNFPLHHFSAEWDDFPNGEVDWPNLIVYHLADVLNHCCRAEAIRIEDYDRLKSRAEL